MPINHPLSCCVCPRIDVCMIFELPNRSRRARDVYVRNSTVLTTCVEFLRMFNCTWFQCLRVNVPFLDDTHVIRERKETFPILVRHCSNIDRPFFTVLSGSSVSFKWKNTSKMLCLFICSQLLALLHVF